MREISKERLQEIIESHGKWVRRDTCGIRADLSSADLRSADLCGTNLIGADLRGTDLRGADLRGADLRGADLRSADLCGTNLIGADLRGTDLRGTNLIGADLRGTDLRGADLSKRIVQVGPIGSRKDYTVYNVTDDIVQCGCWNDCKGGSLEEFKSRIDEAYPAGVHRAEYLAAIGLFEAMKNIAASE